MLSLKPFLVTASVMIFAAAQIPKVAFTFVPAVVVAGQSYNITWGGGDGTSVSLILREGDPDSLSTIGVIGTNINEDYYTWQVSRDLSTASDYALQITQGLTGINYSGEFSLVGGTSSSSIAYRSYSSTTTRFANTTTSQSSTNTGASAASMRTGTAMSRNTTFSSMALTSSTRTTTVACITAHTTSTRTTSSQSTSVPTNNAGASNLGSSAALVIGLLGGAMFLQ